MSEHFVISGRFVLKLLGLMFVVALLALMNVSDVHRLTLNKVLKLSQHFTDSVILQPVKTIQEKINEDSSKLVIFEMAVMPFPFNGIWLIQVNLPYLRSYSNPFSVILVRSK